MSSSAHPQQQSSSSESAAHGGNTNGGDSFVLPPKLFVRFVKATDEHRQPIICSFPGGVPESLLPLSSSSSSSSSSMSPPKFTLQQTELSSSNNSSSISGGASSSGIKRIKHTLVGKDETCMYSASITVTATTTASTTKNTNAASSAAKESQNSIMSNNNNNNSSNNKAKGQRSRMCIGIFDKVTNKLVIHETFANGNVFALKQCVPSYKTNSKRNANEADTTSTNMQQNGIDSYMKLHNDFGSTKKQKVIKSQMANRVQVDSVIGSGTILTDTFLQQSTSKVYQKVIEEQRAIHSATTATGNNDSTNGNTPPPPTQQQQQQNTAMMNRPGAKTINDAVDLATEQWRKQFLPPYDMYATKIYHVYDLRQVVGTESWSYLMRLIDACIHGSSSNNNDDSPNATATTTSNPIDWLQRDPKVTRDLPRSNQQQTRNSTPPVQQPKGDYWNNCIQQVLSKLRKRYVDTISSSSSSSNGNTNDPASGNASRTLKLFKEQLAYTIFVNHLINLIVLLHNTYRDKPVKGPDPNQSRFLGTPIAIGNRFLELFATPLDNNNHNNQKVKYTISKVNLDRCYVHILLLYLRADGGDTMYSNTIDQLFHDLQLDSKHGTELYKQAGCTVHTNNNTNTGNGRSVSLQTPLTFPNPKRGGSMGRGK